jgi:hypothetical protein
MLNDVSSTLPSDYTVRQKYAHINVKSVIVTRIAYYYVTISFSLECFPMNMSLMKFCTYSSVYSINVKNVVLPPVDGV